jgi:signal transduction histidine kinase
VLVEALLHETVLSGRRLNRTEVDLGAVLGENVEFLRPELTARAARVTSGPLPVVLGEPALLDGLLKNLLVNALKYGPRRGSAIHVSASRGRDVWRISIASEGPPIANEERMRIFQPFRRGYGERRARGAGLGLSVCQRIVERHDGTIGVEPSTGAGNVFFFTLPA